MYLKRHPDFASDTLEGTIREEREIFMKRRSEYMVLVNVLFISLIYWSINAPADSNRPVSMTDIIDSTASILLGDNSSILAEWQALVQEQNAAKMDCVRDSKNKCETYPRYRGGETFDRGHRVQIGSVTKSLYTHNKEIFDQKYHDIEEKLLLALQSSYGQLSFYSGGCNEFYSQCPEFTSFWFNIVGKHTREIPVSIIDAPPKQSRPLSDSGVAR